AGRVRAPAEIRPEGWRRAGWPDRPAASALLGLLQQRVDLRDELRGRVLVALLAELDEVVLGAERGLDVRVGRDQSQRLVDLGRLQVDVDRLPRLERLRELAAGQ